MTTIVCEKFTLTQRASLTLSWARFLSRKGVLPTQRYG